MRAGSATRPQCDGCTSNWNVHICWLDAFGGSGVVDLREVEARVARALARAQQRRGYSPSCGCFARQYVLARLRLVELDVLGELRVHQRLLEVLRQTARDAALPWRWRRLCLAHAELPLSRLQSLLALHDPIAWHAMRGAVQSVGDELAAAHPYDETP